MIFSSMAGVRRKWTWATRWAALPVLALALAGCGAGARAEDGRLPVVATTTQAADMVRQAGGDRVAVTGLLAPSSDPHDYELRPDDVRAVAGAKVVVRSGGEVDEWLDEAIEASGTSARVVTLIDHVDALPRGGDVDPHWWQDPTAAESAVEAIGEAIGDVDGAAAYARRIAHLDGAIGRCMRRVPPAQRRLVTTHDALGYYARRYDIDVVGTVIPSLSTQGQPSAGETARLIRTIRRAHVSAIFTEQAVNPDVERAIAAEAGARIGRPLWADTLGPAGSPAATYLGALRENTLALVDGFTDGRVTCRLPA
jgi:zinc/manganese transport system substrate-binding protein